MEYVCVHSTNHPEEALVVESLLESCGIKCKISQESIGRIDRIFCDGLGDTKLFVPEDRAEEAREILAAKPE